MLHQTRITGFPAQSSRSIPANHRGKQFANRIAHDVTHSLISSGVFAKLVNEAERLARTARGSKGAELEAISARHENATVSRRPSKREKQAAAVFDEKPTRPGPKAWGVGGWGGRGSMYNT